MSGHVVDQDFPLYAVRFWGLNSLFWTHMKLFVKDILHLKEYNAFKGVYCYANIQPIMRVEILGYIVSVDVREKLTTYGVDDGSGTISCCQWHTTFVNKKEQIYDLGQLITVQGKVSVFREQRQLTVDLIHVESDPNCEVLFWLEAVHLGNAGYKEPFTLPPNVSRYGGEDGVGELSKEKKLKRAIVHHIRENKIVAFQFRTFCLEPGIQLLARGAVRQNNLDKDVQGKKPESSYEERKIIRQVIKDLERDGILYFKDSKTDLFEVVSHEHNLGPAILKAIKKLAVSSNTPVSIWAIMDVLHSSYKFHHVNLNQVVDSLDRLLQSSQVYKQNEHEYCLV